MHRRRGHGAWLRNIELKFLGDGLLAFFAPERVGAERACSEALSDAVAACGGNAALNIRRTAGCAPTLDLSIVGDVI
jgi:hypothetical protein